MSAAPAAYPPPTTGPVEWAEAAPGAEAAPLCRCGCGNATSSYRAVYLPGHDSRHISQLVRSLLDVVDGADATREGVQRQVDEAFVALSSERLQDRLYSALTNYGRGRMLERLQALRIEPFTSAPPTR